ncbi:uncharacterized protein LOC115477898 [Microcaecilia unicolor]|uniref:Uncharacterized protein LOC115477898 n=1 Tax=Microcaecilia unicolor TaxID=1415580 RepID=A0A6P7Z690_9AMPH|nr:uncharacterized protein LOC115477898 [Microcaecilia unicolor]
MPYYCWISTVSWPSTPQPIQIQLNCLRGVKDKVPKGRYVLKVSLLSHLGGCALQWSRHKEQQWPGTTLPVNHAGNFYNVEMYFNQDVHTVPLTEKDVKPGMTLLFELFLLHGANTYIDRVVGWGAFPFYDDNFVILEGKFKCPFLRGHYNTKIDRFRKIEDLIQSDVDNWLCNLYFQVGQNDSAEQCLQQKSGQTISFGKQESEEHSESPSYLEELEKHRFSVCCNSVADVKAFRSVFKHTHFVIWAAFSEVGLTHWCAWNFWTTMLHITLIWFVRLYLHYCTQWLFLRAISVPVSKFQFSPHTVELCYQNSLLHTSEELVIVLIGPLALNAVMLLMVLISWSHQTISNSLPSFLSKFIIVLGFWTMLDPLAIFVIDIILGRLSYSADNPVADAAKLYWLFYKTEQSGIPGILITVLLYTVITIISFSLLYFFMLRLHVDSWVMDVCQRIHRKEDQFYVPYDLEISNQELSYIVGKAEQWRGINGERKKRRLRAVLIVRREDCTDERQPICVKDVQKRLNWQRPPMRTDGDERQQHLQRDHDFIENTNDLCLLQAGFHHNYSIVSLLQAFHDTIRSSLDEHHP